MPSFHNSDDVPGSDDLNELWTTSTAPTAFSDDFDAIHAAETEHRRDGPIQRIWKTNDIFRSDPASCPVQMQMENSRPAKAQKVYYGIDIHRLLADAQAEASIPKAALEAPTLPHGPTAPATKKSSLLWTEKYRAKKFTDLVGDERTHRAVMHWLKRWDQIVFPGSYRPKPKAKQGDNVAFEETPHRKILMLTGPPGLGKTTLAHVCAKQAGYEVQEINASDERSSTVVKGRIRDMVGTENVKGADTKTVDGQTRKAGKPVCVVVDEVDGVVGGSGGSGEGGFVKALIDLVMLDQKNSSALSTLSQAPARKMKGDRFRLLRPLILVCNDVYHPALRPLRQSNLAEIIHVRKAPIQTITTRLQQVLQKEGVRCEVDGVRRLCEATWGVSNRKEERNGNGPGEGDMRGIMVVGEWVAGKLRNTDNGNARLTRKWVEEHVLSDLQHGGGAARALGRGGPKDIVERVFQEGAGFPKSSASVMSQHNGDITTVKGVAEGLRRTATEQLRELVDTHGESDRIVTDCFSMYPTRNFQDNDLLSKPDLAHEWLHFHDRLSSAVFSSNEWELAPYLSSPILAFHHLFASPTRAQYDLKAGDEDAETTVHPFAGPRASWAAHEAEKQNAAHVQTLHAALSRSLTRLYCSTADITTELQPYLFRMLSPNVNPIVVGGSGKDKSIASVRKASEQTLVKRAVNAMGATGVRFDRVKVSQSEGASSGPQQWVYRIEPPLDTLCTYETGGKGFGDSGSKTRYAVRQVIDQQWKEEEAHLNEESRLARFGVLASDAAPAKRGEIDELEAPKKRIACDFFGRPIAVPADGAVVPQREKKSGLTVWVTYHEGFSNAVRKPITLKELMQNL
ncbi:hypothetical protein DOTSEDRAFT_86095 [Dothistroma septosporum NZE10]|uniref:AAA+ ATPase domain-containing protein n=1 Tax=Dothistroma septosporum (strain NZE10 / CBS 128990) TaxID=675120 RepID=N1PZM7_DOTSN|nr:hypothetical protein DOTSEDRAFT_86095 [Dothistroma septosporum NZE10]